jgi:NAD(P)-dependent dehydrogenase (short-subunit alcohol dehydrogenase family)
MILASAIALVTGGSDGYGRGIASVLKAAGAKVWITGGVGSHRERHHCAA